MGAQRSSDAHLELFGSRGEIISIQAGAFTEIQNDRRTKTSTYVEVFVSTVRRPPLYTRFVQEISYPHVYTLEIHYFSRLRTCAQIFGHGTIFVSMCLTVRRSS